MEQLELISDNWRVLKRDSQHHAEYAGTYVDRKYVVRDPLPGALDRDRQLEILAHDLGSLYRTVLSHGKVWVGQQVVLTQGKFKGYQATLGQPHFLSDMWGYGKLSFEVAIHRKDGMGMIDTGFNSSGDARRVYNSSEFRFV